MIAAAQHRQFAHFVYVIKSRERRERQAAIYIRSFSYRAVDEERSQNDQSQQSRAGGSNDLSQSGNRKT
jgi:hypothetical protein